MNKRLAVAAASFAVLAAVLTGCSSSSDDAAAPSGAPASASTDASAEPADPNATPEPQATIDPGLKEQVNTEVGAAPVPGQVDSSKQELSEACTEAVAPVREIMAEYKSGLLITSDADNKALTDGLNAARLVCEKEDPQQWADFYASEYFGWLNGATE